MIIIDVRLKPSLILVLYGMFGLILFELIYLHKHLQDWLKELMETTYEMFISRFSLFS